ncbi:MAG: response regulator [Dissulfurispiraceae bacterium]|jgi:two-component system, response regulator
MKKMILIVDDSPTDIELTLIALNEAGLDMEVRSASDGKSALAMLNDGCSFPALILLDIKMPGMDGIEVLRKIRADSRLRDIPIVVVTSSALESDRVEAIAAGASDYMQKPLSLNKFSENLKAVVHQWVSATTYECTYNPDLNIIETSTHGPADMTALMEMVRCIAEICGHEASANVLVDHSQLDSSNLTMSNIEALSSICVSLKDSFKVRKCAHVVADDLQFGLVRAWEVMVESNGLTDVDNRVFKDRNEAIQWIKSGS